METVELTRVNIKYEITITYNATYCRANPFSNPERVPQIVTRNKTYQIDINPNTFNSKIVIPFLKKVINSEDATEISFLEATCHEIETYTSNTGKIYYSKTLYFNFDPSVLDELIRFAPKGRR